MRKIQILGTGCLSCQQLAENAEQAVRDLGVPYEVEKVTDLDEIAKLGLIATPALIVNGHIAAAGDVLAVEDVDDLALGQTEFTRNMLDCVQREERVLLLAEADEIRQGFGIQSVGVVSIYKKEAVIALLEVGRGVGAPAVTEGDLCRLQEFSPYVAMAVDDCLLQEEMPQWDDHVEGFLGASEKWTG